MWSTTQKVKTEKLKEIILFFCGRYLSDHCWTVAKVYRGVEMDEIINREENLPLHIEELRNAIFEVMILCATIFLNCMY